MIKRRIYTLRGYPPEVVAVAFAKCSRSPEPFDAIASELSEDTSRKFHEKWIVGYGHSSVAEHAVLSIAVEGVSILATKVIEDNRLASYTEKSTRYQVFDKNTYYKPRKIMESSLAKEYTEAADSIMDAYQRLVPLMLEHFRKTVPRNGAAEKLHEMRLKNMALDACRYLLPVSVQTNLGMTVNARQLEHAITKLLSHPLEEMNNIGMEIRQAALGVTPTLVKYTEFNNYLDRTHRLLRRAGMLPDKPKKKGSAVVLAEYERDALDRIVSALIYRGSHMPYSAAKNKVRRMSMQEKESFIDRILAGRGKFDRVPREFELAGYTFDIMMDYGAFRDIQRHRMATQVSQELTARHGYLVPEAVGKAGLADDFTSCMDSARDAYEKLAGRFPDEAQYIVPLGFKKRLLFACNLRELFHIIPLRTGKTAHASYREVAQKMHQCLMQKAPALARHIVCHK